jgi:hypothetical protein
MWLFEYVALGTWGFWAILAIIAIAMSELLDTDHPGLATIMAIGTGVLLWLLGVRPLEWISTHIVELIEYAVAYVISGLAWSLVKWYFWLVKIRRFVDELQAVKNPDILYALRQKGWPTSLPPKVSDSKSKIIGWMTLWPARMVWTLLHDPVTWIFEEIYALSGRAFQKIADSVFKDIEIGNK